MTKNQIGIKHKTHWLEFGVNIWFLVNGQSNEKNIKTWAGFQNKALK